MIDGVEILTLRQRRSATGDHYFTGRLGEAVVVMIRDDIERDVWKVIAGDPARANSHSTSPARALAPPPVDEGDSDDGDHDEGDEPREESAFDELPADLTWPPCADRSGR
jgi:hypothetical protein